MTESHNIGFHSLTHSLTRLQKDAAGEALCLSKDRTPKLRLTVAGGTELLDQETDDRLQ